MRTMAWLLGSGALALALISGGARADEAGARRAIDGVLDAFHQAAGRADAKRYFAQMTEDAVFLGTDASERWPRKDFEAFVRPYFAQGKGWTYASRSRRVDIEAGGTLAWFDELLENEHYGTCRGSGVLRRVCGTWRIAQYNLSIPIPNPLARDVVSRIRAHAGTATSSAVLYLVRHAEKEAGDDPDLSAAGRARAAQLASVLRSSGVDRIYATEYKRTQQTVAPTAKRLGVASTSVPAAEVEALAKRLRSDTKSKAALIAGHGNTVPKLLAALGVESPVSIGHDAYDRLFVVRLRHGVVARFETLHYGGETP